jgi:hypothetical protein
MRAFAATSPTSTSRPTARAATATRAPALGGRACLPLTVCLSCR